MKERKILALQLMVIFLINIIIISMVQLAPQAEAEAEAEAEAAPNKNNGPAVISQSNDIKLLARLISAEAGDEPYPCQVAVGAVVINRVNSPSFPNSISGVIYQPGAFTSLIDGQFDNPIADSAYKAAEEALSGWDLSGGAIYYFDPATEMSGWIRSRPVIITIGNYKFCS